MSKKIIVACGGGVATSTLMFGELSDIVSKNKLDVTMVQCSLNEIDANLQGASLIVSSAILHKEYSIPVLHGLSLITGVGVEEFSEKLVGYLK